jgi:NAD(P) transhydrogenase subunit alpha
LAAEQGGNCGYTEPDRALEVGGVTILGYTDLTSRLATQSSQLFGTNLVNLLSDMTTDGECIIDLEDEVVRKSLILRDGVVTWPPPPDPEKAVAPPPTNEAPKPIPVAVPIPAKDSSPSKIPMVVAMLLGVGAVYVGLNEDMSTFVQQLTVFVLACFVGWQVVWNETAALHTPLMSVTNAISGIIIVGGMLQAGNGDAGELAKLLGAIAILVASINIVGGFLVTHRMLAMFRK